MKINKYWETDKKRKRTLKRKMKFNKTYRGSLTKRRRDINSRRAVAILAMWCMFATTYAFAMTSNNFVISNDKVVEEFSTASEATLPVTPERSEANVIIPLVEQVNAVMVETKPTIEDVKKEIIKQSKEFGLNENMMLALADCESDFGWKAKNPTSTARGVYQYLIGTWEETESAKKGFERNDIEANIREAMIDVKSGESWRWRDCGYKLRAMGYNF